MTGGSTSINHSFTQYRELGASARAMLVAAAARRWNVDPATCRTAQGVVTSGSHTATYGELAADAMAMRAAARAAEVARPVPHHRQADPARRFARRARRDAQVRDGLAPAGHDGGRGRAPAALRRTGCKLQRGGGPRRQGVVEVVEIPTDRGGTGVAVIANGYWPARLGRDALQVTWKDTGSTVTSAEQMQAYKQLAGTPGTVVRTADAGNAAGGHANPAGLRISVSGSCADGTAQLHGRRRPPSCACGIKIWGGSSMQTTDRAAVAKALGVAPEKVQIFTMMSGGDYGRRSTPTSDYVVEAARVSAAYLAAGHRARSRRSGRARTTCAAAITARWCCIGSTSASTAAARCGTGSTSSSASRC